MPRLPVLPAKDILRLLIKYGCVLDSARGSHFKVRNLSNNKTTVIPIHGKKDLDKGFLADILSQLGIDVEEFLEFMQSA